MKNGQLREASNISAILVVAISVVFGISGCASLTSTDIAAPPDFPSNSVDVSPLPTEEATPTPEPTPTPTKTKKPRKPHVNTSSTKGQIPPWIASSDPEDVAGGTWDLTWCGGDHSATTWADGKPHCDH
jgi:hypothetical protein